MTLTATGYRMARAQQSVTNTSLCDVDYWVTSELMAMDYDNSWEQLAQSVGYTFESILRLKNKRNQRSSPTEDLLWELGCEGYTVKDLYEKLESIRRKKEMSVLQEYVCKNGEPRLSSSIRPTASAPSPLHSLKSNSNNSKEVEAESIPKTQTGDLEKFLKKVRIPDFDMPVGGATVPTPSLESSSEEGGGSGHNYWMQDKRYGDKVIPGRDQSIDSPQLPFKSHPQATESDDHSFIGPGLPEMSNGRYRAENVSPVISSTNSSQVSAGDLDMRESFSYRELYQATNSFGTENLIGEGAFGKVYKGILRGQDCAIKRLNMTEQDNETNRNQVLSELAILSKYRHENIVLLYGYALDGREPCLVYQYLANGSLQDRIMCKNGSSPLTWERRLNILMGACLGLNFLHTLNQEKPVIHGDIKSANILLDQHLEAKLADLGQAHYARSASTDTSCYTHVSVVQTNTKVFGTTAYHAREVLSAGQISIKSDVYAMGVVFLEVCSGLPAYDPNRGMGRFLASLFEEVEEDEWAQAFMDRKLQQIPANSFTQLLTVAKSCIQESKNRRPKTEKLLAMVKECYNSYTQHIQGTHPVHGQDNQPQENDSIRSIDLYGDSLPLRLQLHYDQRQAGVLHAITDGMRDKLGLENPHLQPQQSSLANNTNSPVAPCVDSEHFPQGDPKKLEEMARFDNETFGTSCIGSVTNEPVVYESDPRKMRILLGFEDDNQPASTIPDAKVNTGFVGNGSTETVLPPSSPTVVESATRPQNCVEGMQQRHNVAKVAPVNDPHQQYVVWSPLKPHNSLQPHVGSASTAGSVPSTCASTQGLIQSRNERLQDSSGAVYGQFEGVQTQGQVYYNVVECPFTGDVDVQSEAGTSVSHYRDEMEKKMNSKNFNF